MEHNFSNGNRPFYRFVDLNAALAFCLHQARALNTGGTTLCCLQPPSLAATTIAAAGRSHLLRRLYRPLPPIPCTPALPQPPHPPIPRPTPCTTHTCNFSSVRQIATSTPRSTFNKKMSGHPELAGLIGGRVVCGDEVAIGQYQYQ